MIFDKIESLGKYEKVNEQIKNIINFLDNFDKNDFKPGRIDINENLFASLQSYKTIEASKKEFEVHEKYIDLQYLLATSERIDFATEDSYGKPYELDQEGDYFLTNDVKTYSKLALNEGDFAIFFPGEFHKPGCSIENDKEVKKIVFKIKE